MARVLRQPLVPFDGHTEARRFHMELLIAKLVRHCLAFNLDSGKIMTRTTRRHRKKSDSGQKLRFRHQQSDPVAHVPLPRHPCVLADGFAVEGFPIGAARLPTVRSCRPQWCGTIHMVSPFLSPPSGQYRALHARSFPLASGVFPSSGVSPPPRVPTTFGRSPLPWCTRPVPSMCTFCVGRSQRLAPPAGVPPSVASLGRSEHPRPPGCGPAQPGLKSSPVWAAGAVTHRESRIRYPDS
jgi:hypothetical protein